MEKDDDGNRWSVNSLSDSILQGLDALRKNDRYFSGFYVVGPNTAKFLESRGLLSTK